MPTKKTRNNEDSEESSLAVKAVFLFNSVIVTLIIDEKTTSILGHEPTHDFTHLKQDVFLSYGPLSLVLKSPLFDGIIRTLLTSIGSQPYGTGKKMPKCLLKFTG